MTIPDSEKALFNEISLLIEQSKQHVISQANSTLTLLFWNVGKCINSYVLQHQRAQYGKQIVATLSRQLVNKYGRHNAKCLFYAYKAIYENLGVRALRKQITQKTYERTALQMHSCLKYHTSFRITSKTHICLTF